MVDCIYVEKQGKILTTDYCYKNSLLSVAGNNVLKIFDKNYKEIKLNNTLYFRKLY